MALTLDRLLEPVSEDQPAGEDLSYDHQRAQLEQAFEREDRIDGEDGAEPDHDWREVLRLIEQQFARSKDLWLAVYLARAGAEMGSLETVELGVEALAGLVERFWDSVHPQLDELGVPGRKAPCDSLANRRSFIGPLERTVIIAHPRLGRFSGEDLKRFRLEGAAADGYGMFRAAVEELGAEGLEEALGRLRRVEEALRRADAAFMAGAEGEDSPNYAATYATLSEMRAALQSFLPGAVEEAEAEPAAGGVGASSPAAGGQRSVSGAVNSRDDVIRVLDLVGDYYRLREPSHPMPLMIERMKHWVTMDFLTLMKDLAPNGVDSAGEILNTRYGVLDSQD